MDRKNATRILKFGLIALLLIVPVIVVFALDGGDTCADAVPITALPFNDTGDTTPFNNDLTFYTGTCTLPYPYGGEDEIYEITVGPGNLMNFSMDLAGSAGDLALFIISDCGDGTTCVINSQDAIGPGAGPEIIDNVSLPTGTHYLYIDSYYDENTPGSAGTFSLSITGTLGDVAQPDIAISKGPDTQTVTNNGIADFTIAVTNTGDITLTNVTVSDALAPACDTAVGDMGPGETAAISCSDLGSTNSYTNTAVVTSTLVTGGAGPTASDDAFVEVIEPTSVSLSGFGSERPLDLRFVWLAAVPALAIGAGFILRRKRTA